jgi:hypothetical protein
VSAGLLEELARATRAQRSATIDDLGSKPTLWLAVAPLWTRSVAEATGFPVASVTKFVSDARDVGWCESRGSRQRKGSGDLQFWIPDEARREVLDILSQRDGIRLLRQEARAIAERVASTQTSLPDTLRDWAELMSQDAPEKALVDRVRDAVEADDLSHAQQLVVAGEALAPLLAGVGELAVDRSRRLMNLGARRRQDGRALGRYLDRQSLSGAVSSLLNPDPDASQWALHLRGVGGIGKTMLVRYLASGRYAAERGSSVLPIARADFDHISADYPVRRPVQLLLELADELTLHTAAITGADRALSSFRATVVSAHEALSSLREESVPPLEHPLVLRAIDDFAQAVDRLPGVVLLILDTCEELAKADAGNPAAPAVQATLSILERVHGQAKSTRVLFAGRRPLPSRSYLAVRDVAGFTVAEARSYLTTFSARPLARDLEDALIRLSPAVDMHVPPPGELPERVNPFDLALYLSWAEEDPGLDVRRIETAGRDAYVEGRIVDRLSDPVILKALPVVALLGRSRVSTLASLVDEDTLSADVLGARFAEQEWIDADNDPPNRLTVKPGLTRGLRHYFSAPARQAAFTATANRLATSLRRAVTNQPLADIDVDELLAALRLSQPAEAAELWEDITRRVEAPPGRWGWLLNVARRVLGEFEEDQWPTAEALRATVMASYVAARRRADPSFDPHSMWTEVRVWADRHPNQTARQILRARAALGSLPDAADDGSVWADLQSVPPNAALAAAAVDAAHCLLEDGARDRVARLLDQGHHLRAALDGEAGRRVQAWALVVLGRLRADENRHEALRAMTDAEAAAAAAGAEPAWADWVPPEDLLARVRIERGLLALVDSSAIATLPRSAWVSYAEANLNGIDGERLASLCLQLHLAGGPAEQTEIERWERLDSYEPARAPSCSAHDLVPPLCVTLAEAQLAAGRPERALALIQRRRTEALSQRHEHADDRTLRLLDAETVRLIRRLRLDDQRATLVRLSDPSYTDPSLLDLQNAARRAMAVVHGEPPKQVGPEVWSHPAGWHAWWQCQLVPPPEFPIARWVDEPGEPDVAELADIELDLEEVRQLGHPAFAELQGALGNWLTRTQPETLPVRSADPFREVRAGLRRDTLAGRPYRARPGVPGRRLGEVAFEEAELLALRLPSAAARLFQYAAERYAQAGDAVGQMMAAASRAAIATGGEEQASFEAAWDGLRREHPEVAATLTRPAAVAGPWRYWAALKRQLLYPPSSLSYGPPVPAALPSVPAAATPAKDRGWIATVLRLLWLALVVIPCVTVAVVIVDQGVSSLSARASGASQSSGSVDGFWIALLAALVVILLAAIPYLITWFVRICRLADGRGLRTVRPQSLRLTATVRADPGQTGQLRLLAELGPLREAPTWQRPRLARALPAVHLIRTLRSKAPAGYVGEFPPDPAQPVQVSWTKPPKASGRWWRKGAGAVRGDIELPSSQVPRPWERNLAASLGPGTAGRIEWVRRLNTFADPYTVNGATGVTVDAPTAWRTDLDRYYDLSVRSPGTEDLPLRLRHAVGRALATSAGPRLDVSGEATAISSANQLLDAEHLVRERPALVVLQAEPTDELVDLSLQDDLPERLALAADLIEAGVPAVLVLPALPIDLARTAMETTAAYAASPQIEDARLLRAQLRRALNPHVEPAVLDDLVLFVNSGRDQ